MIEVAAKEAIAAIKILQLAPAQAGIPSSSFVRVYAKKERLRFSLGGDLFSIVELYGKGDVKEELLFVGRWEFLSFFQTANRKPFQIEMDKGKLTLRQGRRKASLSGTAEGVGYPEMGKTPSGKEIQLRSDLLKALEIACSCSSGGPNTELHCVFLQDKELLASDQMLAFSEQLKKSVGKESFLLPMPIVPLLKEEGVEKLVIADQRVIVLFPSGKIFHPLPDASLKFPQNTVGSLLQGQTYYVKHKEKTSKQFCITSHKHISKKTKWPEVFRFRVSRLDELLQRFSVYLNGVEKLRSSVVFEVVKNNKEATFKANTQYAKFNEKVELEEAAKQSTSVQLPVELLLPFTKYWTEKDPKRSVRAYCDTESPCLLVCGTSRLMVPSHALSEKKETEEV